MLCGVMVAHLPLEQVAQVRILAKQLFMRPDLLPMKNVKYWQSNHILSLNKYCWLKQYSNW